MLKPNLNAIVKFSITIWFIQSIGWKNGAALDHSVWEPNFHSIINIWSNHCQTLLSILLSTHLRIYCKEIWMDHKSVYWVLDMKILLQISGIMYCWENNILLKRFLNINWIKLDNHFCTGIQWIWDVQLKIWLKIIWLWLFIITLLSGMILNSGLKPIIVMVIFSSKDKKCLNQQETLLLWLMQFNNTVLILQDLLVL